MHYTTGPMKRGSVSENVSARIMPAEKAALEELLRLRAAKLAEQGEPPDETFAGWLRAIIRREAKEAGVPVETVKAEKGRKK